MTRPAWMDDRLITDASGSAVTVWSYKPREGQRIADGQRDNAGLSGIGPGSVGYFAEAVEQYGHAILESPGTRPWNHHVAGCGIGHDDARFAESGMSMAAWYESGEAFGGHWWENEADRRKYGFTDVTACFGCDVRGVPAGDGQMTAHRYCEACLAS